MKKTQRDPLIISGSYDIPSWGFCLAFTGVGLLAALIGLSGAFSGTADGAIWLGRAMFLGIGALFSILGGWMFRLRRDMLRAATTEQLREMFGMDAATLERLLAEQDIRPRYVSNGHPYYDPADFDAATLLRPASSPALAAECLLRPASASQTPPHRLLRPVEEPVAMGEPTARSEEDAGEPRSQSGTAA